MHLVKVCKHEIENSERSISLEVRNVPMVYLSYTDTIYLPRRYKKKGVGNDE